MENLPSDVNPDESNPEQTKTDIPVQFPKIFHHPVECSALCLMTQYLKAFLMEDKLPSSDEFSESSKAMLKVLNIFGVSTVLWEKISKRILINLHKVDESCNSDMDNAENEFLNIFKEVEDMEKLKQSEEYEHLLKKKRQIAQKKERLAERERRINCQLEGMKRRRQI